MFNINFIICEMSQESNDSQNDNTQFFIGTPSEDEVKQYFLRQKRFLTLLFVFCLPHVVCLLCANPDWIFCISKLTISSVLVDLLI